MLRVPSHVSGIRCVFAQNYESERDSNISASLSLVPHRGTPCADSHLTLDFVVPCPLSLPSQQTKDIFGQTQAGWRSRISSVTHLCSLTNMYHGWSWDATLIPDSKYDPACLRVLAHSSLLLRLLNLFNTAFKNLF